MTIRLAGRGVLAGLLMLASSAGLAADTSLARVEQFLGSLKTLSTDFVQVVRSRDGQITSRATGTLSLSRPDRFRWDYRTPYAQVIVADGRNLWLYDSDLAQVTVRPLESGLGSTPAMLLSGAGSVADSFTGGAVETDGPWTWCRLTPKDRATDFELVSLGFNAKGELAAMELKDKLGQTTALDFSNVRRNVPLDASLFRFEPPKGADVIGEPKPKVPMLQLRRRRQWIALSLVLLAAVLVGSLQPNPGPPVPSGFDKVEHLAAYILLSLWFTGLVARGRYWVVASGLLALGLLIEVLQWRMNLGRSAETLDMLANTLGVGVGITLALLATGGWAPRLESWLGWK